MIRAIVFDCFGVLCDQRGLRNELVIAFVKEARKHHKTALLSNVSREFIDTLFHDGELDQLFDETVISSEAGVTKPNPLIYEKVAMKLGVLPEECVMIDDSPVNVEGARQVGMKGLCYQTLQQAQEDLSKLLGENHA